jgi:hypothetical protein
MGSRILPMSEPVTEALVVRWLNAGLTAPRLAVTDLPTDLEAHLPLVQVIGSTGSADGEVTVYDRVDVYNMAASRSAMWALTAEVHNLMRTLGGAVVADQLIDLTRVVQRPSFLPWSTTVPRTIAVYEIQYRPRPV